ncbi:MAG TPA: hypothetical protein DGT21_13315 [Armatimonadetes bacterium]|jgi:hypothetical protein|nr:hypothetical protein [Armatimonadota bacterium]
MVRSELLPPEQLGDHTIVLDVVGSPLAVTVDTAATAAEIRRTYAQWVSSLPEEPTAAIVVRAGTAQVEIGDATRVAERDRVQFQHGADAHEMCHSVVRLISRCYLAQLYGMGGCLLHASAARVDGVGCVFLGPSGAGKTTVAQILSECGADLLASDNTALLRRGQCYSVRALPFPFDPDVTGARARLRRDIVEFPVDAVFVVQQGAATRIEPAPPIRAADAVQNALILRRVVPPSPGLPPRTCPELQHYVGSLVLDLLVATPVYMLTFPLDLSVYRGVASVCRQISHCERHRCP